MVKKDGTRAEFDPAKVRASMTLALRKRPVSVEQIDAAIERIDLLGGPQLQFKRDGDALRLTLPPPADGAFVPAIRIRRRGLV